MATIKASVGKGGVNLRADVRVIQQLLKQSSVAPQPRLNPDGEVGPRTISAIEAFQKKVMKSAKPDGRIDPGGKTLRAPRVRRYRKRSLTMLRGSSQPDLNYLLPVQQPA